MAKIGKVCKPPSNDIRYSLLDMWLYPCIYISIRSH